MHRDGTLSNMCERLYWFVTHIFLRNSSVACQSLHIVFSFGRLLHPLTRTLSLKTRIASFIPRIGTCTAHTSHYLNVYSSTLI